MVLRIRDVANSVSQGDHVTGGTSSTKSEMNHSSQIGRDGTGFQDASGYNAERDSNTPYQNQAESEQNIGKEFEDSGLSGKGKYHDLDEMERDLSKEFSRVDSGLAQGEMPSYEGKMMDSEKYLSNSFSEDTLSKQAFKLDQPIDRK